MNYSDRHKAYPGTVIISYPFRWGGQLRDRWMWLGELGGEVWDYDSKQSLAKKAEAAGLPYVILRVHRGMRISVIEVSPCKMKVSHNCFECGFEGDVLVEKDCRVVICPNCGTKNDFWLVGETPPARHKGKKR